MPYFRQTESGDCVRECSISLCAFVIVKSTRMPCWKAAKSIHEPELIVIRVQSKTSASNLNKNETQPRRPISIRLTRSIESTSHFLLLSENHKADNLHLWLNISPYFLVFSLSCLVSSASILLFIPEPSCWYSRQFGPWTSVTISTKHAYQVFASIAHFSCFWTEDWLPPIILQHLEEAALNKADF
jgi:hypothetical protein